MAFRRDMRSFPLVHILIAYTLIWAVGLYISYRGLAKGVFGVALVDVVIC